MTFLEKAMEINEKEGSKVSEDGVIDYSCPRDYELEENDMCEVSGRKNCEKCWNREMPDTEPKPQFNNPVIEKAYNTGLNDGGHEVWDFVRKLYDMKCEELEKIFDVSGGFYEVIRDFSPQEALSKLKEYEDAQIKIGDVIKPKAIESNVEILVTKIYAEDETFDGFIIMPKSKFGGTFYNREIESYKKTGKHIDIQSLLSQIGGE